MWKQLVRRVSLAYGYNIVRVLPRDLDPTFWPHYYLCKNYTMTTVERMYALYKAVKYLIASNVPGAIVECGVWKGGSSMLCASGLLEHHASDRRLYLYDTYEGMPEPTDLDVSHKGEKAIDTWRRLRTKERDGWSKVSVEEVRHNMLSTGYPVDHLTFVKGKVENTIPRVVPEEIALLRLDTDWYESTYHELCHLFPRVAPGGVLLIDDYGYWQGAKAAVDRYLAEKDVRILLQRVDYSGRVGVKTS